MDEIINIILEQIIYGKYRSFVRKVIGVMRNVIYYFGW